MTFIEYYRFGGNIVMHTGISLAILYAILSLVYFCYRYAKGDDIPAISSVPDLTMTNLLDIRYYINPFYFKHPVLYILTAMGIFMMMFLVAAGWPVLLPVTVAGCVIFRMRQVNLHKKKMWEELKS